MHFNIVVKFYGYCGDQNALEEDIRAGNIDKHSLRVSGDNS